MTHFKKTSLLMLLLISLGSCSKFSKLLSKREVPKDYTTAPKVEKITQWSVETFYIMQDVTPELGIRIMEAVRTKVLKNKNAIRELTQEELNTANGFDKGFGFAIHPMEVSTLEKLARIQKVIVDFSEKEVVPLQLVNNVLNFQSVYGAAVSFTQIFGAATANSKILIDDGSGKPIETVANQNGEWEANIQQNDRLRERNGFIFLKIYKGNAIQYLEMDVLTRQQRRIQITELPRNSILR